MSGVGRRLRRDADLRQPGLRHRRRPDPVARPPLRHGRGDAVGADRAAAPPARLAARPRRRRRARASAAAPSRPASTSARLQRIDAASRRCCSTPTPRSSRSQRSRCAASRPAAASSARSGSPRRRRAPARRRRLGAIDVASASRWRSPARLLHRLHTRSDRVWRQKPTPCRSRRAIATGAAVTSRSPRLLDGGMHASGEGVMSRRSSLWFDGDADRLFTAGPRARRGLHHGHRVDHQPPAHGRARRGLYSARRSAPLQLARRRVRAVRWSCLRSGLGVLEQLIEHGERPARLRLHRPTHAASAQAARHRLRASQRPSSVAASSRASRNSTSVRSRRRSSPHRADRRREVRAGQHAVAEDRASILADRLIRSTSSSSNSTSSPVESRRSKPWPGGRAARRPPLAVQHLGVGGVEDLRARARLLQVRRRAGSCRQVSLAVPESFHAARV